MVVIINIIFLMFFKEFIDVMLSEVEVSFEVFVEEWDEGNVLDCCGDVFY